MVAEERVERSSTGYESAPGKPFQCTLQRESYYKIGGMCEIRTRPFGLQDQRAAANTNTPRKMVGMRRVELRLCMIPNHGPYR